MHFSGSLMVTGDSFTDALIAELRTTVVRQSGPASYLILHIATTRVSLLLATAMEECYNYKMK